MPHSKKLTAYFIVFFLRMSLDSNDVTVLLILTQKATNDLKTKKTGSGPTRRRTEI